MTNEPAKFEDETEHVKETSTKDYEPIAVACAPEGVTLETLNEQNSKYWNNK